ncbi:hypothetical protein OEZ71_00685 [Defluviimonas sp. WL0050]|uniref:Uncharacterized protein n=1 Tax=Albidovulum litorale TaxID=2984134 RepID=A0ABT2ZID0_9RHOB|nr:hypothetical protein [Defluviimonas sp. WL0050]MCV2870805.1 hypothetical protein [Defluviimonas sp. WL0050]
MRTIVIALLFALPAHAAGWEMRDGDEPLGTTDVTAFLMENEVRFYDGGQSEYGPDGAYAYIYEGGDRAEGHYRIEADGAVCVDFVNGFSRCDLYVRNGQRVLLIDQNGNRYPLR